MFKDTIFPAIIFFSVIVFVIISCVLAALAPYFEAQSFNKCTGGHATYVTAVFTELRVQECK